MRICVGCSQWSEASLCRSCRGELFVATPVRLGTGLEIFPAYRHSCTARRLVHRLKYAGIRQAGEILASAMVAAMPTDAAALVPVPRAMLRRARYGVDPAAVLAELVGREADIPVMDLLRAPLWWPANAGTTRIRRRSPRFHLVRAAPAGLCWR